MDNESNIFVDSAFIDERLLTPIDDSRKNIESFAECACRPEDTFELFDKLDSSDLEELKPYFFPSGVNFSKILSEMELYDVGTEHHLSRGIPLSKESFITAIKNVIGTPKYEIAAGKLFDSLQERNILKNSVIWWEQLLDAIIEDGDNKTPTEHDETYKFKENEKVVVAHCKSKIVKILLPETPHSSCYIAISSLGKVGIYNDELVEHESYYVPMGYYKSNRSSWVTDACYAPDASSIFISSSNRRLFVYSISQLIHKLQFSIEGIPDSVTCLHYTVMSGEKKSTLFIGVDRGDIITINFCQPQKSFFKQKLLKQEELYNWTASISIANIAQYKNFNK